MFESFQKFIPMAAKNYGVSKELTAAVACQICRKALAESFAGSPALLEYFEPSSYVNGTITINAKNPAFGQEIVMRKEKIIDFMNSKMGKKVIKNLQIQIARPNDGRDASFS